MAGTNLAVVAVFARALTTFSHNSSDHEFTTARTAHCAQSIEVKSREPIRQTVNTPCPAVFVGVGQDCSLGREYTDLPVAHVIIIRAIATRG